MNEFSENGISKIRKIKLQQMFEPCPDAPLACKSKMITPFEFLMIERVPENLMKEKMVQFEKRVAQQDKCILAWFRKTKYLSQRIKNAEIYANFDKIKKQPASISLKGIDHPLSLESKCRRIHFICNYFCLYAIEFYPKNLFEWGYLEALADQREKFNFYGDEIQFYRSATDTLLKTIDEFLPNVTRGKKVAEVQVVRREMRKRKYNERHEEYIHWLINYFKENPNQTLTRGRNRCAEVFKVDLRTIRRHTEGMSVRDFVKK
ncbi:MAG: hypothetical protein WC959_03715 [Kiritimatiellales bacterium]